MSAQRRTGSRRVVRRRPSLTQAIAALVAALAAATWAIADYYARREPEGSPPAREGQP